MSVDVLSFGVTKQSVDIEARNLRATFTATERERFLDDYSEEAAARTVARSPFALYTHDFPAADPIRVLAFSLHVTNRIVRYLADSCNDPARLGFLSARVAELGMYSIVDPATSNKPVTFLAASKRAGYFFTPPEIALIMADRALGDRTAAAQLLDPAAGCGSLLTAVLLLAEKRGVEIGSVRAIERDQFTHELLAHLLRRLTSLLGVVGPTSVECADALSILVSEVDTKDQRPDCIVMNPPYRRIKFLRSTLTNAETRVATVKRSLDEQERVWKTHTEEQAVQFRAISKQLGLGGGTQDYQRLFTSLALKRLAPGGTMVLISPISWLGDRDAFFLRKQVMGERLLREIIVYPENTKLFATVNQPTAVAVFARTERRDGFQVRLEEGRQTSEHPYEVRYHDLERHDPQMLRIPRMPRDLYQVCETLQSHARVRDVKHLKNARGELDQTLGRELITSTSGPLRLIRGDHIERFALRPAEYSDLPSYVDVTTFGDGAVGTEKHADTFKLRIVGRQCSYMKKGRRLSFALVEPRVVLGNSCNYLRMIGESTSQERMYLGALTAVLNSIVVEWYFRIYNSNNHVANYEIDDLPVCLDDENLIRALAANSDFLHYAYRTVDQGGRVASPIEDVTDALVALGFGLTPDQTAAVVAQIEPRRAERIANMTAFLAANGIPAGVCSGDGWYQHVSPALSDLDREVVRHVPQGGNWQDIPVHVPSKRLEQIREMTAERGVVRTTYYGRLRPDQPAYTIATYYNRPGNGTNIHPWENRTLTSREAARLQSFPDYYCFLGTEGSVRKQVGNAVPPLLAHALGSHLRSVTTSPTCVDLFAGAGGLSLGLELAGWQVVAALDSDRHAVATYEFNRPCEREPDPRTSRTLLLDHDVHDNNLKQLAIDQISAKLGGRRLALLVGGPPCQGFSHAGWRVHGDKRNDLAIVFMDFVNSLKPELVVLENVEGLLTHSDGRILTDLLLTLRELGYDTGTSPWCLNAEQYGVPQMRRRVFLIGSRSGVVVPPPRPTFARCKGRRESADEIELFDRVPYPITTAEALRDLKPLGETAHRGTGRRGIRPIYAQWSKGLLSCEQFVELATSAIDHLYVSDSVE